MQENEQIQYDKQVTGALEEATPPCVNYGTCLLLWNNCAEHECTSILTQKEAKKNVDELRNPSREIRAR